LLSRQQALNDAPQTLPLVRERLDDKSNDGLIRGMLLDRLEAAGEDVSELDPWYSKSIEELDALSAGIKVPAAVSKLWNADLVEMLAPLGEPLGQRCC